MEENRDGAVKQERKKRKEEENGDGEFIDCEMGRKKKEHSCCPDIHGSRPSPSFEPPPSPPNRKINSLEYSRKI